MQQVNSADYILDLILILDIVVIAKFPPLRLLLFVQRGPLLISVTYFMHTCQLQYYVVEVSAQPNALYFLLVVY